MAGQVGVDKDGNLAGDGSMAAQTRQTYENIRGILESVGATFSDVVEFTDLCGWSRIRPALHGRPRRRFPVPLSKWATTLPTPLLVIEGLVREEFLVEIKAVAALPVNPKTGIVITQGDRNLVVNDNKDQPVEKTPASLEEIHGLFQQAVAEDPSLSLLKGFKIDFSGNPDFHKVYLAVRCQCGTAALLSVEVAMEKTLPEVETAMPSLLENLRAKQRMFSAMSCEMHSRMRQGGV